MSSAPLAISRIRTDCDQKRLRRARRLFCVLAYNRCSGHIDGLAWCAYRMRCHGLYSERTGFRDTIMSVAGLFAKIYNESRYWKLGVTQRKWRYVREHCVGYNCYDRWTPTMRELSKADRLRREGKNYKPRIVLWTQSGERENAATI